MKSSPWTTNQRLVAMVASVRLRLMISEVGNWIMCVERVHLLSEDTGVGKFVLRGHSGPVVREWSPLHFTSK